MFRAVRKRTNINDNVSRAALIEERKREYQYMLLRRVPSQSLMNLRSFFHNLIFQIEQSVLHKQPIKYTNVIDLNTPDFNGITWDFATEFVGCDYSIAGLKSVCKVYGYEVYVRAKAGYIYIAISNDKNFIEECAYKIKQMHS